MENLFNNLQLILKPSEDAFYALKESISSRSIKKNEYYLQEGKFCSHIGLVASGAFRSYYSAGSKEISKSFAFENDYIGSLASFLSHTPSKVNIMALEDSIVAELPYDTLFNLIDGYSEWKDFSRIIVEDRFLKNEHREASLLTDPPEVRFRKLLEEHPKIFKRVPLQHIASYLSITPETLSRYRTKLRTEIE